jgi:hypothetical protein
VSDEVDDLAVEGFDMDVGTSMPSCCAASNSSRSISSSVLDVGGLSTARTYSASLSSGGRVTASAILSGTVSESMVFDAAPVLNSPHGGRELAVVG